jgi:multidrug efflux system membrane fusion protein
MYRPALVPPWLSGLAALSLLVAAAGCGKHGKAAPVGGSDVPPSKVNLKRNVELTHAEQRPLVYYVDTVGVLEAEGQTEIAAGVNGVVDEVLFREGDEVTADKVLIKIDQKRYVSQARVAEANVQRAEATLSLAKDLARRTQIAGQGASVEEKAKSVLALNVAEAELESARATLELARHYLARSQVRAPYSGRINQRKVTPGTYVEEKTPVAMIADLSRLRLVGWVPETAAPVVRELMAQLQPRLKTAQLTLPLGGFLSGPLPWAGVAACVLQQKDHVPSGYDPEFVLLAFPRQTFRGRIFYLNTVASPDTHMFEFKADLDVRALGVELKPGFTARIRIPLSSSPDACVIPEEAVRASERGFIAFVPTERRSRDGMTEWVAKARTLDLGYRSPGWVEVRHGISPGELIVRRGAEALEDGTPIKFPDAVSR